MRCDLSRKGSENQSIDFGDGTVAKVSFGQKRSFIRVSSGFRTTDLGGRDLSERSPSTPSKANRSCHRQTVVLLPAGRRHDRVGAEPSGRQQHDARPPNVLLRHVPTRRDGFELRSFSCRDREGDARSHLPTPPLVPACGTPKRTLLYGSHH